MALLRFNDQKSELDCLRSVFHASERGTLTARPLVDSRGDVYDFRYGIVNRMALELLDISRDQIEGKTISAIFGKEADDCIGRYKNVWMTGEKFEGVVPFNIRGLKHWFEVRIVNANEQIIVYFKDVTLVKQTDLDRQEFDRLRESLLQNPATSMWVKSLNGKYTYVNQAMRLLLGKDLWDIIGKDDTDLFPPGLSDEFRESDRRIIESKMPTTIVQKIPVDGKEKIFVTQKFPIYGAQGDVTGIAGISTESAGSLV